MTVSSHCPRSASAISFDRSRRWTRSWIRTIRSDPSTVCVTKDRRWISWTALERRVCDRNKSIADSSLSTARAGGVLRGSSWRRAPHPSFKILIGIRSGSQKHSTRRSVKASGAAPWILLTAGVNIATTDFSSWRERSFSQERI